MNIGRKAAIRATHTIEGEVRNKPFCMPCMEQGKREPATARELHSCSDPAHVKHMRAVTRWAKRTVGLACGDRIN